MRFDDNLACLLARSSRSYVVVLNVGRVKVKENGHVCSCEGITLVVLVIGSSSSSGLTGYVELLGLVGRLGLPGTRGVQQIACG